MSQPPAVEDEPKERLPPRRGQYVRVVGGSDAPHGRVVKVAWLGLTSAGLRVGFRLDGRKLSYTSVENVEVVIEHVEIKDKSEMTQEEREAEAWAEARFGRKR